MKAKEFGGKKDYTMCAPLPWMCSVNLHIFSVYSVFLFKYSNIMVTTKVIKANIPYN